MCSASFFMEIKMYSERNIVKEMYSPRKKCIVKEIHLELLLQEIWASYES